MKINTVLLILSLCSVMHAENLEKSQKKELEAQVKTMTAQAEKLEKSGELAEARAVYADSQALIEMKDVTDAIKRLDEEIRKRVKDTLNESNKLYESRKYTEAAAVLDKGMKLQSFQAVLSYNLALCYFQLGQRDKALEYVRKAKAGMGDPKQKTKVLQLVSLFVTGEHGLTVSDANRDKISRINRLSENVGMDAFLEDAAGEEDSLAESTAPPTSSTGANLPSTSKTSLPDGVHDEHTSSRRSSLCNGLSDLQAVVTTSPSAIFNLANCSESNSRAAEALKRLEKYLQMAPDALDAEEARARISDLKALLSIPGQNGVEIRRLYASIYEALAERKYDHALGDLKKANDVDPEFALSKWKLALLYEAMGNIELARANFVRYEQMESKQSAKDEANLHLSTLDAKRAKYDEETDEAEDIIADLFNRSMNLTFNGSEKRSALRAKRARVKKKEQAKARNRVGGFSIPFAYAQQQLSEASEHLQIALALFPLGAEANELMGLIFLQANDSYAAIKNFDVVASQGLPVSFYAEMRGHKQDQAVKCELSHDRMRLIYLSSYDKKGNPAPPNKPAGDDGLGDMVVEPSATRQQTFDSLDLNLTDIKKVETDKGLLKLKLAQQEIYLSPIYLPSFTPIEGPPARRFANNYTRLFVRYPGLEDSKLGSEGMTGGEKFVMGYKIATAGVDIAMSGFSPISAIGSVQDAIDITRTIHSAMASLSVSFSTWEKSVDDQQHLLAGKSFKAIPMQPVNLTFVQDVK